MKKQIQQMTLEELEREVIALGEQRNAIQEQMRIVRGEIDRRLAERAAREKLERMSDAERAALAQIIAPQGFAFGVAGGTGEN